LYVSIFGYRIGRCGHYRRSLNASVNVAWPLRSICDVGQGRQGYGRANRAVDAKEITTPMSAFGGKVDMLWAA
ncbi:MAG: hypothetical protein WAK97_02485, partial [Pseudolabrys sp.]